MAATAPPPAQDRVPRGNARGERGTTRDLSGPRGSARPRPKDTNNDKDKGRLLSSGVNSAPRASSRRRASREARASRSQMAAGGASRQRHSRSPRESRQRDIRVVEGQHRSAPAAAAADANVDNGIADEGNANGNECLANTNGTNGTTNKVRKPYGQQRAIVKPRARVSPFSMINLLVGRALIQHSLNLFI